MDYTILGANKDIAQLNATEQIITDVRSALDAILSVQYETGCNKLIINKSCFSEDFFVLSTGIAGEILQKFVNYHVQLAIIGDYSKYTSKPLRDFIFESNQGHAINFLPTVEEAITRMSQAF